MNFPARLLGAMILCAGLGPPASATVPPSGGVPATESQAADQALALLQILGVALEDPAQAMPIGNPALAQPPGPDPGPPGAAQGPAAPRAPVLVVPGAPGTRYRRLARPVAPAQPDLGPDAYPQFH
jgi:hypothetical protein